MTGGRGVRAIALEIKNSTQRGQPYSLAFAPTAGLSQEEQQVLEAHLKRQFEIWATSWIIPQADEIIAKYEKKGK